MSSPRAFVHQMRRQDIQGIRGYAIIIVVLYHLWPAVFSNGWLGVDIFFVLSGYLMTLLYAKKIVSLSGIFKFYEKRLCRLLPMYSLLILGCLVVGKWMLVEVEFDFLRIDAAVSLVMGTNVRDFLKWNKFYTQLPYDYKFLQHTWSLAAEVQFYLVSPLFFYLQNRHPPYGFPLVNLFILCLFLHFYFVSNALEYFFPRFWEFQIGSLAATCKFSPKPKLRLVALLFVLCLCVPKLEFPFAPNNLKMLTALATGAACQLPSKTSAFCPFSNRFLTHFGDISYVLYLLHWPVIFFCHYYFVPLLAPVNFTVFVISYVMSLILFNVVYLGLSVLVHYYVEKPLLGELSRAKRFTLVCYALSWSLILVTYRSGDENRGSVNEFGENDTLVYWSNLTFHDPLWPQDHLISNAINRNQQMFKLGLPLPPSCYFKTDFVFCKASTTSAKLKIMVIGDDFSLRLFPAIYELLKLQFATLEHVAITNWVYPDQFDLARLDYVQKQQFDLIFIVNDYYGLFTSPFSPQIGVDHVSTLALNRLLLLSSSTKALILSGALMRFPSHEFLASPILEVTRRLYLNKKWKDFARYPYQDFLDQHSSSFERINRLIGSCPKCVYFDFQAPFCDDERVYCRRFDEKSLLSYYNDHRLLSAAGVEKIMPSLSILIERVLREVK